MKLLKLESPCQLRQYAAAWDDLWWRSASALPTHRGELLAQWLEHFAASRRFIALAVEADGQLVAALPLVGERKLRVLPVGAQATNCWTEGGALLVDAHAPEGTMALVAQGLCGLNWPLLSLDDINAGDQWWGDLRQQLTHSQATTHTVPRFHNGLIDITHDWDGYVAALSGNHRSAVKRSLKKLRKEGDVRLQVHSELVFKDIEPLLHTAFEIEDRSWKGEAGTSILRSPGMFDYFLRQSQQLAQWGQLELLFLTLSGQAIAFEYCYHAKGVIGSHKIGYDARFSKFGPGRLLRYLQLERYFADPQRRLLDTMGILCEAKAKWCTRSQEINRLMVAPRGLAATAIMQGYKHVWPRVRNLIGRRHIPYVPPALGAEVALATPVLNEPTSVA